MKLNTLYFVFGLLILGTIIGVREVKHRAQIQNLEREIQGLRSGITTSLQKKWTPLTTTLPTGWSSVKFEGLHYSLQYPDDWMKGDTENAPLLPKNGSATSDVDSVPLHLAVSSNVDISPEWVRTTLASGEVAYYSFENGFDHYYVVNGANMLIWSFPARSYNSSFSDKELSQALQIVNTYKPSK
jgi:hypothetical protein